jgi:hypothetical protein
MTLSQQALEGTGIEPRGRPGRGGVRPDPVTGEVVTLAGAPTSTRLGDDAVAAVLSDDRDAARWKDTLASCAARRPGATVADRAASSKALVHRSGHRWGGA